MTLANALVIALGCSALLSSTGSTFDDPEYIIDSWETEQGLPENSATAMVQTPDGYLWFGTFNGLVRFDGVAFTVLDPSNTPELPSRGIVNLHLDASQRLWVSTYRGLVVSEPRRYTSLRPVTVWSGNYVRTFSENGGVLCATSFDGKVMRAQGDKMEMLPDPPGKEGSGYLAYVDRGGRISVSQYQAGFYGYWDGRQWNRSELADELHPEFVSLTGLPDGRLLVVKSRELLYIEGERISHRVPLKWPTPLANSWSVSQDHRSNVWISAQGLYRVSPSGEVRHFSSTNALTYKSLRFAFEDQERNLWVGSSGGGLMRFKPRTFMSYGEESGLAERNVSAVLEEAPSRMLIGTYGGGLFRSENGRISSLGSDQQPRSKFVQCLLRDRDQGLWVGSYAAEPGSICLMILSQGGRRDVSNTESGVKSVNALFQDSRGRVWIGGSEAVSVYADGRFMPQGIPGGTRLGEVHRFAEDRRQGDVYIGSSEGLFRCAGGEWREVKSEAGASVREVTGLHFENDGGLWLGGVGAGLLRLKDGRWSAVTDHHGLPKNQIACILEDDQDYWWLGLKQAH